jgi:hypothetical protein
MQSSELMPLDPPVKLRVSGLGEVEVRQRRSYDTFHLYIDRDGTYGYPRITRHEAHALEKGTPKAEQIVRRYFK